MANTNTAKKKNTSAKKPQAKKQAKTPDPRRSEKWLFVCLAFNIYLLLSNFIHTGFLGKYLAMFFFGLFGTVAYILPIYFFLTEAFLLSNGALRQIVKRVVCVAIFIVAVGFIFQLMHGAGDATVKSLYMDGATKKQGGGLLIGGLLVLIYKLTGTAGAVIITILLFIIGIIVVLDVSVLEVMKTTLTPKHIDDLDDDEDDYAEEDDDLEDLREKRAARRAKNKRNSFEHIRVLEGEDEKKKKNRKVPEEEVHEIRPVADNEVLGGDFFNRPEFHDRMNQPEPVNTDSSALQPEAPVEELAPVKRRRRKKEVTAADTQNALDEITAMVDGMGDSAFSSGNAEAISGDNTAGDSAETGAQAIISGARFASKPAVKRDRSEYKSANERKAEANGTADKPQATVNKTSAPKQSAQKSYQLPPIDLLNEAKNSGGGAEASVRETAVKLKNALETFGVKVTVTDYSCGPSVTRYELQPEQGVKVSKITNLQDDIKLALAATDIRIEAPIPGKSAVGIEVPNKVKQSVSFRELVESKEFQSARSKITFAVGKDIGGKVIIADIAKMPHLMIAGSTGSGKSVCINTLIMSILYKADPKDVKLIMVDPKQVELTVYNGIPHMLIPVVTDPKKAAGALNWAVAEMTKRYQLFAQYNVRNLEGYNAKVKEVTGTDEGNEELKKMPQIVIIVDELADLMMVAHGEVEDAIVRISQLARAAGIHLVIATQRPSVDVITGLIKANVPSRIAMKVSSGTDSRTILDMVGAEKLLGNGDMLFYPTGFQKPVRLQGSYLSDSEIGDVCDFLKDQVGEASYDTSVTDSIENASAAGSTSAGSDASSSDSAYDEYFAEAGKFIISKEKASIGMLQRVYKIGFNRAARIMDQLAEAGVVGPEEGTKPRKILMTEEEFEEYLSGNHS